MGAAIGRILLEPGRECESKNYHGNDDGRFSAAIKHGRCVLSAVTAVGGILVEVEVSARRTVGACLLKAGRTSEAVDVLRPAQEMDPSNRALRDQFALTVQ